MRRDREAFTKNAYVCTYRQIRPFPRDNEKTLEEAAKDPLLQRFLDGYERSFYDWGDDPSFFAAKHLAGKSYDVTWGVCRRDVRNVLEKGDVVVFFCGSGNKDKNRKTWHYYFISFGTVAEKIWDRKRLWTQAKYATYRKYYNVLTDRKGNRSEMFHPFHKDWQQRARAPYIVFDPATSCFNTDSPHEVATWNRKGNHEIWNGDPQSEEIGRLLFVDRGITNRRLRTSKTGFAHVKLNLVSDGRNFRKGLSIPELTEALRPLI